MIARIREARAIHQDWVDYMREHPSWAVEALPRRQVGGGIGHHERWVRIYNDVLRELGEKPFLGSPAENSRDMKEKGRGRGRYSRPGTVDGLA